MESSFDFTPYDFNYIIKTMAKDEVLVFKAFNDNRGMPPFYKRGMFAFYRGKYGDRLAIEPRLNEQYYYVLESDKTIVNNSLTQNKKRRKKQ